MRLKIRKDHHESEKGCHTCCWPGNPLFTVPKELLPIVDTPILLFVVKEAIEAGIEDLILIAGRNKHAIEDFFDRSFELEDTLVKAGKEDLLKQIREIQSMINIVSIRQKEAKGLGHAVHTAKPAVGEEPFAVLLGDEIMVQTKPEHKNVTQQLCQIYSDTQTSTVAVMEVPEADVSKYGIVQVTNSKADVMSVETVVEKPKAQEAPSRLALPGRYVFSSSLFHHLENLSPGKNGEIQLTDGMTRLAINEGLFATRFSSQRYDAGDKLGYLMANIELGLQHPEVGQGLRAYLKNLNL